MARPSVGEPDEGRRHPGADRTVPGAPQLAALHVPVVIVDPVGQPDPRIPLVGAANWAGGLMATEHLIELGHRRIGTITGRPALLCSQARVDGYRAALEHAGIPVDPALVCTGDFHFEAALAAATDMFVAGRPAHRDLRRKRHRGDGRLRGGAAAPAADTRRPGSVVGFDDLPMSGWVSPPLTTVAQPLAQMAAMATHMVLPTPGERAAQPGGAGDLAGDPVPHRGPDPPTVPISQRFTEIGDQWSRDTTTTWTS